VRIPLKSFPQPLTADEEQYYMQKYTEGDLEAKYILIEHNLRLVAHVVKKYQHLSEDTEDLISIGTIGLIKAVMTFNPDKGVRLATYAARCIENELLMLMRSRKKLSGEVSLYEPIGTDKEGNEIRLFDIMESDAKEGIRTVKAGTPCPETPLRALQRGDPDAAGNCKAAWYFQILCL